MFPWISRNNLRANEDSNNLLDYFCYREAPVSSSRIRFVIFSFISLGLIVFFIFYLYANKEKYQDLFQMSPLSVGFLFALSPVFIFVDGMINISMFRNLGAKISITDGFLLSGASAIANQLPISGGIISKGYYLKSKYNLGYSKFASAMLALFFCFIAVNGAIGSVVLLYWVVFTDATVPVFLIIGFLAMTSCVLVFWLPVDRIHLPNSVAERLSQALDGWSIINRNPVLILKLTVLQTVMMLLLATRYWLAFHMLSQNVTPGQAILFSAATVLTQLVSFAPGGLGVRESIVAGVASLLGFDVGVSVVAVGLDRLVATIVIVLLGGVGLVVLGKQISDLPVDANRQE